MEINRSVQIPLTLFIGGTLLLTNLVWSNALLDPFMVPRFMCLSASLLIGLLFLGKHLAESKSQSLNLLDLLFIGYYLVSLASVAWSINKAEAIFDAQKALLWFAAYYVFKNALLNYGHATEKIILRVLVLLSYIATVVSIYKIIDLSQNYDINHETLYMIGGTVSHKNLLSILLLLLLPFNLLYFINEKKSLRWLSLPPAALCILVILVLQTRSVYLGLMFGVAAFSGHYLAHETQLFKRFLKIRLLVPLALGLTAVISVAILFYAGEGNVGSFLSRFNVFSYLSSDTGVERLFIWKKTAHMLQHNWLTGVGKGSWKLLFPSYGLESSYRAQFLNIFFVQPHNDFLWVWSETGIIGLLFYLGIFFLAFQAAIRVSRSNVDSLLKAKILIAVCALLAYCVAAFFDFPMERAEHQLLLALLFALVVYYGKDFFAQQVQVKSRVAVSAVRIGIILLTGFNLVIGYYRFIGDKETNQVLYFRGQGDWEKVKKHATLAVSPFYNMEMTTMPVMWYKGVAEFQTGNLRQAYTDFQSALKCSPYNFHVLNNIGSLYVENKEYQKAVDVYLKALAINPVFDEAKYNIAIAYYHLKNYDAALHWASQPAGWEKKKKFQEIILRAKEQQQ